MNIMIRPNSIILWREVVQDAEKECAIKLEKALEEYLTSLLCRYVDKPDAIHKVVATAFLKAMQSQTQQRDYSLQQVGDQCLLLTGLFPLVAKRRSVKIRYFVDLGKAAYSAISSKNNGVFYQSLAGSFVLLMDVLQSIRQWTLLPLEAYEQWQELGSQRALTILKSYTGGIPFKIDDSYLK